MLPLRLRRLVRREHAAPGGTALLLFVHGGLGDRVVFEAVVREAVEAAGDQRRIVVVIPFHGEEYDARRYRPGPDEVWILEERLPDDVRPLAARVQRAGVAAFGWAGTVRTTCFGPPLECAAPEVQGCGFIEPYAHLAALASRGQFPRFLPADPSRARAASWVRELRAGAAGPAVALHCRGRGRDPGKNPSAEDLAGAARLLRQALDARLVAIGDDVPAPLAREVDASLVDHDPGLDELGAALEACDLFVGGESGPLHLAAAVGLPVVGLLAPEKAGGRWGPFAPMARVRELVGQRDVASGQLRVDPAAILGAARALRNAHWMGGPSLGDEAAQPARPSSTAAKSAR